MNHSRAGGWKHARVCAVAAPVTLFAPDMVIMFTEMLETLHVWSHTCSQGAQFHFLFSKNLMLLMLSYNSALADSLIWQFSCSADLCFALHYLWNILYIYDVSRWATDIQSLKPKQQEKTSNRTRLIFGALPLMGGGEEGDREF